MAPRDDTTTTTTTTPWITEGPPRIRTPIAIWDRHPEWEFLTNQGPFGVLRPPEPSRAALQGREVNWERLRASFDAERLRAETMTAELQAAQG